MKEMLDIWPINADSIIRYNNNYYGNVAEVTSRFKTRGTLLFFFELTSPNVKRETLCVHFFNSNYFYQYEYTYKIRFE